MAKLVPAVQRYCQADTLRTARWGPVALWGLLGRSDGRSDGSASDVLERMASEAMSRLRPSAVAEAGTPAAIQTICSIGRVAPRVFAGIGRGGSWVRLSLGGMNGPLFSRSCVLRSPGRASPLGQLEPPS